MITWNDVLNFVSKGNPKPDKKIVKTDEEWKKLLTEEQFIITRKKGTERPFVNGACSRFEPGIYACACCNTLLFDASEKFQSGTGWPSFTQPIKENAVAYAGDNTHGMVRVEILCNTCDSHLGHVFPDGPPPSGLRYCTNAASLKKVVEKEKSV